MAMDGPVLRLREHLCGGRNNGKAQRGTGLQDERHQEGDPSTDVGLIEANETGKNSRLRVCVRTRHGPCGESGPTLDDLAL
jgi:hypothetical protein